MRRCRFLTLAGVAVAVAAGLACGASIWTRVTAANAKDQRVELTLTVRDVGPLKEVTVRARARSGELSPVLQSTLRLRDKDRQVASCLLAASREEQTATYQFQLAPELLEHSEFVFGAMGYVKRTDEKGQTQLQPMPSGDFYEFRLKDLLP